MSRFSMQMAAAAAILVSASPFAAGQAAKADAKPEAAKSAAPWTPARLPDHWEGNTLVVDVTNSNAKGRLSRSADFSSANVHNVVRITFLDANNARYEATFDDPTVYTRPWTFGLDLKRGIFGENNPTNDDEAHYEQWEEACYEGMRPVDRSLRSGNPIGGPPAKK